MNTSKLLLERLPADFHHRLCNWGDVMRDRQRQGVSPTYEVCQQLKRMAGKMPRAEEKPELDEADAVTIEAAWRLAAGYRMEPRQAGMLRAYYVLHQPPFLVCRLWSMRIREFDDTLVRAVNTFQELVALQEMRRHNPPHSVLTTV